MTPAAAATPKATHRRPRDSAPSPAALTPFLLAEPEHRLGFRSTARAEHSRARRDVPAADPVFRLVVGVQDDGEDRDLRRLAVDRDETVTLTKGKKVTLMNTADGTRYELVLVSTS